MGGFIMVGWIRTVLLRFVGTIAFILIATSPLWAATAQIFDMTADMPTPSQGWQKSDSNGVVLLRKDFPQTEDDKRGSALIQIAKPIAASRAALPAGLKTFVATLKDMEKEDVIIKRYGKTVNGYDIRMEERCCAQVKSVSITQFVVGIASDDRQAYLQLLLLNVRGDRAKSAEEDFAALVRSLKIKPTDKSFGVTPSSGDGGLDGAFTYLDTGIRPNAFGGTDFYADSQITLFEPSGIFTTELPTGGRSIADHCQDSPTDCGTYKVDGGGFFSSANEIEMRSVTSRYGTIETEKKSLARKGQDLVIGDKTYVAVPPLPEGTTFNGRWSYTYASSGMTAMSSGSIASGRDLTLRADGTFERTGWSGASTSNQIGSSTTGVAVNGWRPAEKGRYRVKGYQLDLVGADGRSESLSLFEPAKGSDEVLVINGQNYLKADAK